MTSHHIANWHSTSREHEILITLFAIHWLTWLGKLMDLTIKCLTTLCQTTSIMVVSVQSCDITQCHTCMSSLHPIRAN